MGEIKERTNMQDMFSAVASHLPQGFPDLMHHHQGRPNPTATPVPDSPTMTASFCEHRERLSPYRGVLLFLSSLLLWEKPVVLVIVSIALHLLLWYGAVILKMYHFSFILGGLMCSTILIDYCVKLLGHSWSSWLLLFPAQGSPVAFDEVVRQYVFARKALIRAYNDGKQMRHDNLHQFVISALFFSCLFCVILYVVNTFVLVYLVAFSFLLGPGLVKNRVPQRIYITLKPHCAEAYAAANGFLLNLISGNKPGAHPQSNPQGANGPISLNKPPQSNHPQPMNPQPRPQPVVNAQQGPSRPSQQQMNYQPYPDQYGSPQQPAVYYFPDAPHKTAQPGTQRTQYNNQAQDLVNRQHRQKYQ